MVSRSAVLSSLAVLALTTACVAPDGSAPRLLPTEVSLAKGPPGPVDPTATYLFPTADAALDVRSDQQFVSGTSSVYANGVCGVDGKIFGTSQLSGSGDATLHTNSPSSKDRRCTAWPRTLTVVFGPGDEETLPIFMNVREIANGTFQIPVGTSALRRLVLNNGGRCTSLHWMEQLSDGTITNGGDRVNVTRIDSSTWLVESQPYPDNQAYCRTTGVLYNLAVRFTIVSSYPLP